MWVGLKSILCYFYAMFTGLEDQCCFSCIAADDSVALLQLRTVWSPHVPKRNLETTNSANVAYMSGKAGAQADALDGISAFFSGSVQERLAIREKQRSHQMMTHACDTSKWIFIWGTGRSGSTTVLSMLNHLPGVYLSGENYALADKLNAVKIDTVKLESPIDTPGYSTQDSAWYNKPDTQMLNESIRLWVCALRGDVPATQDVKYRGFKEITHHSTSQIAVIRDSFPNAYHIINYRRNVHAQQHDFHEGTTDKQFADQLESMREELKDSNVFELPLEDFSAQRFNVIIGWLGLSTSCRFDWVVHQNKWSGPGTGINTESEREDGRSDNPLSGC